MTCLLACLASTLAAAPLPEGWEQRPLSVEELVEYSSDELRRMRNEIYARHGYVFKSADLASYFKQQAWYKPNPAFKPEAANAVSAEEKANVELLKRIEEGRRAYEQKDDMSQVYDEGDAMSRHLEEASGELATIQRDGSLAPSTQHLTVRLSCRLDVKTTMSRAVGCGHRLDIYDDERRLRLASEVTGLPTPCFLKQEPREPAPRHASTTVALFFGSAMRYLGNVANGFVRLGNGVGDLLAIEYDVANRPYEYGRSAGQRFRFFALTFDGALREVLDTAHHITWGEDFDGARGFRDVRLEKIAVKLGGEQPLEVHLTHNVKLGREPCCSTLTKRSESRTYRWSNSRRRFEDVSGLRPFPDNRE